MGGEARTSKTNVHTHPWCILVRTHEATHKSDIRSITDALAAHNPIVDFDIDENGLPIPRGVRVFVNGKNDPQQIENDILKLLAERSLVDHIDGPLSRGQWDHGTERYIFEPRKWCILVRPRIDARGQDLATLEQALNTPRFDVEQDEHGLRVYVDAPRNPRHIENAILIRLAERGLAERIRIPLSLGSWDEEHKRYTFPDVPNDEPAIAADEITWVVAVRAASAFDWPATRTVLADLRRTTLRETAEAIEVGARDADDAEQLQATLAELPSIGKTLARPLNWFQRWQVRQSLLGNYSGADPDPH